MALIPTTKVPKACALCSQVTYYLVVCRCVCDNGTQMGETEGGWWAAPSAGPGSCLDAWILGWRALRDLGDS